MARVHAGARESDHEAQLQEALGRLAANARRLRQERKLSQEQLAEAVGCAVTFVQRLERGRANTTVSLLVSLARALGVDVGTLLAPPLEPSSEALPRARATGGDQKRSKGPAKR